MFTAIGYNQQDIVKNGLVFWVDANDKTSYPGTGTTWRDLSKSYAVGTLTNGPVYNSGSGGSIVFDGSNDYVTYGSSTSMGVTSSYTLNTWVYWINDTTYGPMFARYNIGVAASDIEIYMGNTGITTVHNRGNGGTFKYAIFTGFTNNAIVNFTLTYSGNSWSTYFNGYFNQTISTAANGGSIADPIYNSGYSNVLGAFYYGRFHGNIYSCNLYNKALSSQEIFQNYNATKGRFRL